MKRASGKEYPILTTRAAISTTAATHSPSIVSVFCIGKAKIAFFSERSFHPPASGGFDGSWRGFDKQEYQQISVNLQQKQIDVVMNMLTTLPGLFVQGGLFIMSLITVLFIGLLLAAWKAPAWVKEIGIITLVTGLLSPLIPLYQFLSTLQEVAAVKGDTVSGIFDLISPGVLFGVKALLIPVIYGMIVYVVSLVIRVIRTPRL